MFGVYDLQKDSRRPGRRGFSGQTAGEKQSRPGPTLSARLHSQNQDRHAKDTELIPVVRRWKLERERRCSTGILFWFNISNTLIARLTYFFLVPTDVGQSLRRRFGPWAGSPLRCRCSIRAISCAKVYKVYDPLEAKASSVFGKNSVLKVSTVKLGWKVSALSRCRA